MCFSITFKYWLENVSQSSNSSEKQVVFFSRSGAGCKGSKRTRRLRQLRPESKKTWFLRSCSCLSCVLIHALVWQHWLSQATLLKREWQWFERPPSPPKDGSRFREFQNPALLVEDRLGLIELPHSAGTARQALANLNVRRAVYVAARLSESNNQPLRTAWPDALFFRDDKDIDKSQCQRWVFMVCTSPYGWWLAPPPP